MSSSRNNENINPEYIKFIVSQVMGPEVWNGFFDIVSNERPRIDMYDSGDSIYILAEIPGVLNNDDINISISSNKLTLKGTTKDKFLKSKPGKTLKTECIYGSFYRIIELPYIVDDKSIKASYENGILEIEMHRIEGIDKGNVNIDFKK